MDEHNKLTLTPLGEYAIKNSNTYKCNYTEASRVAKNLTLISRLSYDNFNDINKWFWFLKLF